MPNSRTTTRLLREPTWFIEWFLAVLALASGGILFARALQLNAGDYQGASATIQAIASPAVLGVMGVIFAVLGAAHMLALIKGPLLSWELKARRLATQVFFLLFIYFAVIIAIAGGGTTWITVLFTALVCGVINLRLRLLT